MRTDPLQELLPANFIVSTPEGTHAFLEYRYAKARFDVSPPGSRLIELKNGADFVEWSVMEVKNAEVVHEPE